MQNVPFDITFVVDGTAHKFELSLSAVRQETVHVIMSVLLKEPFYRRVFAINFTRVSKSLRFLFLYA